jgi:cobalt/nickel transport system permease protein
MHIPDGFLSAPVAAGYGALSLLGVGAACHRLRVTHLGTRALLGVSAAFIFAAQMVNFPIGAGTSGHLTGSVLAVALLGLPSAVVVMTAVLIVQCFVFGDGGVLALGANVFNMALVSCIVGACADRLASGNRASATRRLASLAFAAWCATVVAAASCAEQLALSGAVRWSVVVPAALGVHSLIGVAEAVITALIAATVLRVRPDLLAPDVDSTLPFEPRGSLLRAGLGLSAVLAVLVAPLACARPDGLSRMVERLGLDGRDPGDFGAPLAEYRVPGLGSGALATIAGGCFGIALLFGLCWLLARALVPRPHASVAPAADAVAVVESSG